MINTEVQSRKYAKCCQYYLALNIGRLYCSLTVTLSNKTNSVTCLNIRHFNSDRRIQNKDKLTSCFPAEIIIT